MFLAHAGSVSTSPLTWDESRDSLASDYEARVEVVKLCDDVIWGELVWEENEAPAADAVMCFVCCPCMVPTTNDPQTQNGQLALGKIAWRRLCSCSVLFSLLEAIILVVTCVLPPGIAPMEVRAALLLLLVLLLLLLFLLYRCAGSRIARMRVSVRLRRS